MGSDLLKYKYFHIAKKYIRKFNNFLKILASFVCRWTHWTGKNRANHFMELSGKAIGPSTKSVV